MLIEPAISEEELHRKLHYPVALFLRHCSEVRRIQLPGRAVETQGQVSSVERPQRVVNPVVSVDAELQLLRLGDLEEGTPCPRKYFS